MFVAGGPQALTTHRDKSIMCIDTFSNIFIPKMVIVNFFYTFVSNSFTVGRFRQALAQDGAPKRELTDITSASSHIDKTICYLI